MAHAGIRHARQVSATLTNAVGRPIVLLNRGHPGKRGFPRIVLGHEEGVDIAALKGTLPALLDRGLEVRAAQVRDALGLEHPEDGDEVIGGGDAPAPGAQSPAEAAMRRMLARAGGGADSITAAVDELLAGDGWEAMVDPVIAPILAEAEAAVARGDTLEAFRERLSALFADMDDARLVETLRRMGFAAALSGDAGLADDGRGA